MTRRRWVYTGLGLTVVLAAGLLVWRPWTGQEPCAAAVTATDGPAPAPRLELPDRVAPPFGRQRVVVPGTGRMAVGGTLVLRDGDVVGAVDARTGERLWAFEQHGDVYGASQVGGELVLLQRGDDAPATAVGVGIENGEVRDCVTFPGGERAAETATVVDVARRTVALLRRHEDTTTLSLVDPNRPEPVWTSEPAVPPSVEYAHAAGDVIVLGAAGEDGTSAWELAVDERDRVTPADRRLYAYAAEDGAPLWDWAHEDFAPQVVGMAFDTVVVRAARFDEPANVLHNRLVALDARTGEERWSAELPPTAAKYHERSVLLGDVVVSSESDPERGTFAHLTARDLATGEPLWRIDNRVNALEHAALVGDLALVPGRSLRGLELIDVRTGESRTLFDGVSVLGASADGTSIALQVVTDGEPVTVTYDRA
ncbi:outer membrane protein assembly factor BamB family protein [Actinophytocola gossypii]|uniref:PQQ-binding-like beta-propeller repeat protein n=1 Tax=Actinophytocola gossypii TaxID=2812003 RepID=A0ABT2JM15_9PSEU|nr:PQQ-binding-like beta-propeller repeat protein [Actinophytocola gossypii]MCT2588309.1 PQQ-binding-like beta-propeller repeat protein [Actinophytocola gossypii]